MTMDENKSDLLSEIFEHAGDPVPPPHRPRFEYPPEEEPSSPPPPENQPPLSSLPENQTFSPPPPDDAPRERAGTALSVKLLPWACVTLGAALLVLGVCLLQVVGMSRRLDSLEETVQGVALVDQVQRENKVLQQEQEKLEQSVQQAEWRARELERAEQDVYERYYVEQAKNRRLNYLWYIGRFMESRDYPMAALATALSAEIYFGSVSINGQTLPVNQAQLAQYQAYAQELVQRGHLRELPDLSSETLGFSSQAPSSILAFTEEWDPSKNNDMAALGILWCTLDAHFIQGNDHAASQYLCLYPLGDPDSGYQQRAERLASPFALEQFQLMKDELVESKWLVIAEDGAMSEGFGPTDCKTDLLYNLPFDLPINPAQIPIK